MLKRVLFIILIAVIAVVACGGIVCAVTGENIFYLAGQFFKNAPSGSDDVLATYNGEPITRTVVDYNKNLNILRSEEAAADNDTDIEVINNIVTGMILVDEAERQSLAATETEIENMVQNAIRAYSIPEGKEMMDAYFAGAGIDLEEYLVMVRDHAPSVIARQKLKDSIGRQYCEENGLEFTKVNPPAEMVEAQEAYIAALFEKNKDKIEYFIDVPATS